MKWTGHLITSATLFIANAASAQSVFPDSVCQQPFEISGKHCGYYAGEFQIGTFDYDGGKMLAIVSDKKIPADLLGVYLIRKEAVAFIFYKPNSEGENAMMLGPKFSDHQLKLFEGKDRIAFIQTKDGSVVSNIIVGLKIVNSSAGLPS